MAQYRTEQDGNKITVWDDMVGVGLRFTQGDTLQRYTSELITTGETTDVATLSDISNALTDYAAQLFPYEFGTIKT